MRDDEQLQSVVFFLSDHLSSVLEESDRICGLRYAPEPVSADTSSEDILRRLGEFHSFLDQIKTHELLLVTKLVQARHWALHLRDLDTQIRPLVDLFTVATDICDNMANILGPDDHALFNGAGQPQYFIESRQILGNTEEADNMPGKIAADETFLLGGHIRLLELVRVVSGFRDSLSARYRYLAEVLPDHPLPDRECGDEAKDIEQSLVDQ